MATTTSGSILTQRPINRYSILDSPSFPVAKVASAPVEELCAATGLSPVQAYAVKKAGRIGSARELVGLRAADRERLQRRALFPGDPRLVITDVVPVGDRVMSNRPFALRVSFAAEPEA